MKWPLFQRRARSTRPERWFSRGEGAPFWTFCSSCWCLSNGCAAAAGTREQHLAGRWTRTSCVREPLPQTSNPPLQSPQHLLHHSRCLRCVFVCEHIILPFGTSCWVWLILDERPAWCYNCCTTRVRRPLDLFNTFSFLSSPSSHHQEQTLSKWICRIYLPHMPAANIKISPPPRCF